ncbi:DUF721 domain-containing protein [bacterium]|nr:DUF721 domain-containing protein [bacterium]
MYAPLDMKAVVGAAFRGKRMGRVTRLAYILARWPDVVGRPNALACVPVSLRDRVLAVRTDDASVADRLKYLEDEIVERAGEVVGRDNVIRVRFVVGEMPALRAKGKMRVPNPESAPHLDAALDDPAVARRPELRDALADLAAALTGKTGS